MSQLLSYDLSGVAGNLLRRTWMLQRTYDWQLIMPHNFRGNIGFLVSQYCQDVRFGDYSMRELSILRYGSQQRSYSGLQNIETVTLTFLVPIDNSVYDYFYSWNELIIDVHGHYHPKNEYKRNIYVILYDRTGIQSTKFVLKGTFPIMKPKLVLSYASEAIATLTMELSVDCIEPESFIGSIREEAMNLVGDIAGKAKKMLGSIGSKKTVSSGVEGTEWAGANTSPGFGETSTSTGTFYA